MTGNKLLSTSGTRTEVISSIGTNDDPGGVGQIEGGGQAIERGKEEDKEGAEEKGKKVANEAFREEI